MCVVNKDTKSFYEEQDRVIADLVFDAGTGRVIDLKRNDRAPVIKLSKTIIRIGCHAITVQAMKHIMSEWERHFSDKEKIVTLQ
jgi:hypothetical protein